MTRGLRLLLAVLLALSAFAPTASGRVEPRRRPLPSYDGRASLGDTAGDVALWGPRVVLYPLYLASEYVIRRPMGALVKTAERDQWPTAIADFFTFGDDHRAGIVPTGFVEFGFRPSVGVYGFWDRAFAPNNDLRVRAATGGTDWLAFGVADHLALKSERSVATLRAEWVRRPDAIFAGIGPRSLERDVTRFSATHAEAALDVETSLGGQSMYRMTVGVKSMRFGDGQCCGDPSLTERMDAGLVRPPPGFIDGYDAAFQRLDLAFDTRAPRPKAGSGVRAEGSVAQHERLDGSRPDEWTDYGAALGGLLDVTGTGRVLSLWFTAHFVDPWNDTSDLPFTELVHLGGMEAMRGFKPGRLIGRSSAVATLQHEWPIWALVNGSLQLSVGNVFGPHLADFEPRLLRGSAALGIRTAGSNDHYLEALVGAGTETIADGFHPTSIRLLIGGNHGF